MRKTNKRVGKTEEQLLQRKESRIIAHIVWKCNLCTKTSDREGIADHLVHDHNVQGIEMFASVMTVELK